MTSKSKKDLINMMHATGFDWIVDIAMTTDGHELVASKYNDCDALWWRSLETEGSGFTSLFKGAVKRVLD
jgi:hypothetical protein